MPEQHRKPGAGHQGSVRPDGDLDRERLGHRGDAARPCPGCDRRLHRLVAVRGRPRRRQPSAPGDGRHLPEPGQHRRRRLLRHPREDRLHERRLQNSASTDNASADNGELPPSLRADLRRNAQRAAEAYETLAGFLGEELLARAPAEDPVGAERYALFARWNLGTSVDLAESYAWAGRNWAVSPSS